MPPCFRYTFALSSTTCPVSLPTIRHPKNEEPKLIGTDHQPQAPQTAGPTTQLQLRTGESQLACSLLSPLSSVVKRIGDQAIFSGTVDLDISRDACRIVITNGLFRNVDMAHLTTDTEAAMSGQGWVQA